jgi:bacteriocin-like protein
MEADMANKTSNPRPRSQKRRPADQLVTATRQNRVELSEDELKKVSGGDGNTSPGPAQIKSGLWGEGKKVKIDFE